MAWQQELKFILGRLFHRARAEQELDKEMRAHIEFEIEENIANGMDPVEARRAALLTFGNIALAKEQSRALWGLTIFENLWQDLRFGFRQMYRHPIFTIVALLSLTLGIGANTALFSLINAVLLRPLPVERPEELVSIFPVKINDNVQAFSYPTYRDYRARNEVFSDIFVTRFAPLSLSYADHNDRLWGYLASGNYFQILGVKPILGRTFTPMEDRAKNAHPVAVLSYDCWQHRFGGKPDIIGTDIIINSYKFNVIGVMPKGFFGSEIAYVPEIWVPMMMQEWIEPDNSWLEQRDIQNVSATGRLKPGITMTQATAALNLLAQQLGKEYPTTEAGISLMLVPPGLIHPILRDPVISLTWALIAIVTLVLLLSCANLANLLLARAAERSKEIAIRLALGASRARLIRQLITESMLLALIGGLLGSLLAWWLVKLISAIKLPIDLPLKINIQIDARVLLFSLFISLLAGLLFGLVPALQTTKPALVPALKDLSYPSGLGNSKLRGVLSVCQISLSLILLISAGLVLRTLQHLHQINPGFNIDNTLIMTVNLGLQGYDEPKGQKFMQQIYQQTAGLPGLHSITMASFLPLSFNYSTQPITIEGQPPAKGTEVPNIMYTMIGLHYFETMGIQLKSGRDFTSNDNHQATKVVIVNEAFVHRFFPGQSLDQAIGKRLSYQIPNGPFCEIIGVTSNSKYFSIEEEQRAFVYLPLSQSYESSICIIARTTNKPQSMIAAIRNQVNQLDKQLAVFDAKTMREHMSLSLLPTRITAVLLSSFGLLALLLTAIGIYGLISYNISQRAREIGIRMALGAKPRDILKLVMQQGMLIGLIGIIIGLGGAIILTQLISSIFYGVSATDLLTYSVIALLLTLVVLLASFLPARRVTKVEPMLALKYD